MADVRLDRADERDAGEPTHEYLSAFVLAELAPAERDFLIATSVLDEVDARRAAALGQACAAERLRSLRSARLPVAWSGDRDAVRYWPCLRAVLLDLLDGWPPHRQRALRVRHGRLLAGEGRHEEATEELLRAGAVEAAGASAERAIVAVVERLDLERAERWLDALDGSPARDAPSCVSAELMLALARDEPRRGVRVADRLRRAGRLEPLLRSRPTAAALLVWCRTACGLPADDVAVLATGGQAQLAAALSCDVLDAGMPPVPEPTGEPLDAVVSAALHLFGRVDGSADIPSSPWMEAVTAPWRIASLRAAGRTQRALELLDATTAAGTATLALEASVGPEVLIDAGRPEAARTAIARGRRRAVAAGSVIEEWRGALAQAKLALRVDGDPAAARAVLDRLAADIPSTGMYRELLDTWYGLALLRESQDARALALLRRTVTAMLAGDRILELPTAAVYLAEAEWRAEDEDAADRAADIALEAAARQGSNHVVLQALADFPAVVSRRIDAEPTPDSEWSALGRALIAQRLSPHVLARPSIRLREFGTCTILVHDEEIRPRIAKTYELLGYLLLRPDREASRAELLEALFDARSDDSTRAYLRQAVACLRRLLPDDAELADNGTVRLPEQVVIESESLNFEALLLESTRLRGTERLTATLHALEVYQRGVYLPGACADWVLDRRRALSELATDARCEAAGLAFSAHRHDVAEELIRQAVSAEPLHETAWRLAIRLAHARGDHAGALRAYDACRSALAEIGVSPAPTTRLLAQDPRSHGGQPDLADMC